MGWLQTHLESFVKPHLGFIPEKIDFFSQTELTIIKNVWRSVKRQAGTRPVLLAGRDVFVFEVLARREGYPTIFKSQISRATSHLFQHFFPPDTFLFDTGFVGSIPKALDLQAFSLLSALQLISSKYQVFPHLTGSRSLALKIEAVPKYWTSAKYNGEKIIQDFSSNQEFAEAAGVTIQVYTNSAPYFINERRPMIPSRSKKWAL